MMSEYLMYSNCAVALAQSSGEAFPGVLGNKGAYPFILGNKGTLAIVSGNKETKLISGNKEHENFENHF